MQFKSKKWSKQNRKLWTSVEDKLLKNLINIHGTKWIRISQELNDRNPSQCAQRWKRIKPESNGRRPWTKEEDDLLITLHNYLGSNWKKMTESFTDRSGKSIRERIVNHLAIQINKDQFSKEEDDHIYKRYQDIGPKWTLISKELNNRSENQVKNRFHHQIKPNYLNDKHSYYKISSLVQQSTTQTFTDDGLQPEEFQKEDSCNNLYFEYQFESVWYSNWNDQSVI
ncbi:hypothetical protein pb186bvf_007873 [Paramecium bursaria]